MLGMVPARFQTMPRGTTRMFAMARGSVDGAAALSMKKWITSNYHYMVPEYDETSTIQPDFTAYLADLSRGKQVLGVKCATPVVMGPVSMARLTKIADSSTMTMAGLVAALIPVYADLMKQVAALGFSEIQVHEPVLVFAETNLLPLFTMAYPAIIKEVYQSVDINIVSFMDDVGADNYKWLIQQPEIRVISMDFSTERGGKSLDFVTEYGFPKDKILGVGIVDARNVWKVIPEDIAPVLSQLVALTSNIRVQPSGSLQYCPWDLHREGDNIKNHAASRVLAFAVQKLDEVVLVAKAAEDLSALDDHTDAWEIFHHQQAQLATVHGLETAERTRNLTEADFARSADYKTRRFKQLPGVPALPTTTIGSFPQTAEIRRLRAQWKNGSISEAAYKAGIDQQIAFCIGIQEAIGLDILVHGEAERTDMVEFFAQQMEGMLFTSHGWVQSFGSRCVRPPILWTDIARPCAMTTREFVVAQNLTHKPVKGMLTGPITILNWSFPRADISRKEQAFQIAIGIRDEIKDLEAMGCKVVQVDEPALREGMPLRAEAKDAYLKWAVDAFRLATGGAKSETQIQTHMCYCEFNDCMDAIDRLDTDVNSIENARSDNATLKAFRDFGYAKGFGPGTYDIHSPVVPSMESQMEKINSFLDVLDDDQYLVVNPDCGLKTRTWPETIAALRNMVTATEKVRANRGLAAAAREN